MHLLYMVLRWSESSAGAMHQNQVQCTRVKGREYKQCASFLILK